MGSHTIPYTLAPHESTHVAGGSDDIDSALAIAAAPDLTSTKIWRGSVGNRPVEVDLPAAGAQLIVAETEVFNGTSPTVWTDLDLSGTVGAQATLVLLKIKPTSHFTAVAVRKNGDTDEFYGATDYPASMAFGISQVAGIHFVLMAATDTAGKIEWISENAETITIDIIAYIK